VGLEPTTLRLRVSCSTDWASQALLTKTKVVVLFILKLITIFHYFLQNNVLPSGEKSSEGNSVLVQDVSRHHSGIYICTADNQVGSPASAEIDLKVLCKFFYLRLNKKKFYFFNSWLPLLFRSTWDWSRSVLDSNWRWNRSRSVM
jgi:hypothetical protein